MLMRSLEQLGDEIAVLSVQLDAAPPRIPADAAAAVPLGIRRRYQHSPGHRHAEWDGKRLDVGWAIDVLHPRAYPL